MDQVLAHLVFITYILLYTITLSEIPKFIITDSEFASEKINFEAMSLIMGGNMLKNTFGYYSPSGLPE